MRKILLTLLMVLMPLIVHASNYEVITPGNNVGIGSAVPGTALDVNGTIRGNLFGLTPITSYWVDCNRTDSYPPSAVIGSENFPYKTLGALITGIGTPGGAIEINMKTGTCVETTPTFPNVQIQVNGNGSTISATTVTFPGNTILKDVIIAGNLVQSSTSGTFLQTFQNITVLGNATFDGGFVTLSDSAFLGTGSANGLVTTGVGSIIEATSDQFGLNVSNYYTRIFNQGTLIMDGDEAYCNDNSNYCLDSSTNASQIDVSITRFYQYGSAGGITVSGNGATTLVNPNSLGHTYVFVHGSTNGIVGGTAALLTDMYVLIYTFDTSGVVGYATGTNITGRNFGAINTPLINGFVGSSLELGSIGNVGIGTATPGVQLDVNGTVRNLGEIINGSGNQYFNGNVGISSLFPGDALDVNGTLRVLGNLAGGTTGNVGIGTITVASGTSCDSGCNTNNQRCLFLIAGAALTATAAEPCSSTAGGDCLCLPKN